jgi:hypothetical protein
LIISQTHRERVLGRVDGLAARFFGDSRIRKSLTHGASAL